MDASFSPSFHAGPELALAAVWTGGMLAAVTLLLSRWLRSDAI